MIDDAVLPLKPSRDNYARDCELVDDSELPDHLDRCGCPNHTGVCQRCNYKITVGPSGTEYGHARATNRSPNEDGVRRDCIHRPLQCNPGEPQAWDGYDRDEWNAKQVMTDGGGIARYEHWIGRDCPVCGVEIDRGSIRNNGYALAHKNPEAHPQAGHHVIPGTIQGRDEVQQS